VETECNGLLTYDRAVVKMDIDEVAKANRNEFPAPPQVTVIIPTAEKEPAVWRYTIEKPAEGWFKPDFDATAWKEGPSGFGTKGTPGAIIGTVWKTDDIWLRREFTMPERKLNNPQFRAHHDEDIEVYINGALAMKAPGYITEYELFEMEDAGKAALKPGKNIMAVHCHQTVGGQYVDVGIVDTK
jgi:hypothetical protein